MKAALAILAMLGATDGAQARAADAVPPDRGSPLEILFHADLDGRFAHPNCRIGQTEERPSYARLLGLLSELRTRAANDSQAAPVVLLGGNLAAPDLFGRTLLEQGNGGMGKLARLLGRGGYDAVALGHHDLSLDPSVLQNMVDAVTSHGLAVVVSNLRCDGERASLCERTRRELVLRRGAETIGILATVSPSVVAGLATASRSGIQLDDPLTVVRASTRRLREQGATRVLLMVQGPRDRRGLEELDTLQRALGQPGPSNREPAADAASEVPDVILVGGLTDDDARTLELLRRRDAPAAVGSATGTTALSRVLMGERIPGAISVAVQVERLSPLTAVDDRPQPATDAEAEAMLRPDVAAYCASYEQALSPAPVRGSLSREQLLTYLLEIMRRRAHAEIAIVNRALVKSTPFPITGTVTRGQLYGAIPYKAAIGVGCMTGAAVVSALGPTLANPKAASVGLERDERGLRVNGRPVDKARNYCVATIAFVASGGDGIVDEDAIAWRPLPGDPDLRDAIAEFLRSETASEDGDPSIDPDTDFGPAPSQRLLLVGLTDGGLDMVDTRISNGAKYGDAQLTRGRQQVWKGEWTSILQARHPRHEADLRLNLKYGWTRSQPAGGVATSTETTDLITFTSLYNYRGLRASPFLPRRLVPDPYARVAVESEFTRPALSETQTRGYRHLELTNTLGALLTLMPALKVRAGAGIRKELLTSDAPFGRWRPILEAGGTLSPIALATVGPLPVRVEGIVDYTFVDPTDTSEHQVRATGKLSVPLLPLLFITVGVDVFAVERRHQGWAASYDTTIGLRVHLDSARQSL